MINEAVKIIDQVIEKMFYRYDKQFQQSIIQLCDDMGPDESRNPSIGFIHNGKWYPRPLSAQANRKSVARRALPFQLLGQMDTLVKEHEKIEADKQKINQLLVKLTYQCNSIEEVRDALPNCLWIYAGFSGHQREYNQEAFLFRDKRLMADQERLMPLIEYYLGMSLIL